jgi:endonuclease YncB( thermonuclease family)
MRACWLILQLLGLWCPPVLGAQQQIDCIVSHITDGDTFWARCPDDVKVRLLLIDAPERMPFCLTVGW